MTTPLPLFQVDAFAERPFTGNPAAVIPLNEWLPDEVMQAIGAENNLAETAFTVPSERDDADFDPRWFTPTLEIKMCGHATLGAAHILLHGERIRFAKADATSACVYRICVNWCVRHRFPVGGKIERQGKSRLEIRLVEAGKCEPRPRGYK